MNRLKSPLFKLLSLTRPYSIVLNISMGIVSWLLAGGDNGHLDVFLAGLLAFGLWIGLNWLSDSLQKDPGRIVPPWCLVAAVLLLCLVGSYLRGMPCFCWVIVHFLLVWLYAHKKTVPAVAVVSYLVRAGTVFALCAALASAASGDWWPREQALWFALVQAATHGARNLIGDIRDIHRDKYELPARCGARWGMGICLPFVLVAAFAATPLGTLRVPMQVLVVLVLLLLGLLCCLGGKLGYEKAGWVVHCLTVLGFTLVNLWCLVRLDSPDFENISLAMIAIVLHFTYPYVRRGQSGEVAGWRTAWRWLRNKPISTVSATASLHPTP